MHKTFTIPNFRTFLLTIIILFFAGIINAQTNLIRNSSFEKFVNQNNQSAEGMFYWYNPNPTQILNDWNSYNSSDFYTSAYTPNFCNVPHSRFGDSYAKHGNSFVGSILFYGPGDTKEYINQYLSAPLVADTTYCLSFFVIRADNITHSIHSIGAYFSNTAPVFNGIYLSANPQVVNQNGFISDTTNWVEIRGCFTAVGGEQHITIGNFNSNINTDTLFIGANNPMPFATKYAYYYFDSITLYKNNIPASVDEINKDRNLVISPNPNKGLFEISYKTDKEYDIQIMNSLGKIIRESSLRTFKTQIDLNNEEEGLYFVYIKRNNLIVKQSKILLIK
jgi:hypothetical protein